MEVASSPPVKSCISLPDLSLSSDSTSSKNATFQIPASSTRITVSVEDKHFSRGEAEASCGSMNREKLKTAP
jgi:hypothetical protein